MLRLAITLIAFVSAPIWAQETRVPTSQAEISLSFAPLVKQAAPAVVNIYASRMVQRRSNPFMDDPFFGQMFRDLQPRQRMQNSLGSGVILSSDGIVVSNYHVVGMATDIRVVLNDRREYAAQVLLGDEASDLAILQLVDAEGMPYLDLRAEDAVEVGDLVLAIGNPFGVGQTVSSGIVSGLARSGAARGDGTGYFIQTDAPINPGNSGGALIDMQGHLVGVNTSILTRSGGSNGIGFAIPAGLVEQFVAQARAGETTFQHPWAGTTGQVVEADMVEMPGLELPGGMLISDLHPQSPFGTAGLRVGDVVLAVDNQPVNTPAEMLFRMMVRGIGDAVSVRYIRRGKEETAEVAMITAPDTPARDPVTLQDREILSGVRLEQINPAVIAELGLPLTAEGVVVSDPDQIGRRIGLQTGDILLAVNGDEIERTDQVGRLLRNAGQRVHLEILRGGRRVALRFRL